MSLRREWVENHGEKPNMGYNLWMSEDSHYTLGHRMGANNSAPSDPEPERRVETGVEPSREELDHIDFLMETLARQLDGRRP